MEQASHGESMVLSFSLYSDTKQVNSASEGFCTEDSLDTFVTIQGITRLMLKKSQKSPLCVQMKQDGEKIGQEKKSL